LKVIYFNFSTFKFSNFIFFKLNKKKGGLPLPSIEQNNQTCIEHAKAFADSTKKALTLSFDKLLPIDSISGGVSESADKYGPEEALKFAINHEMNKYRQNADEVLKRLPEIDLRTDHILVYLNCNVDIPNEVKIIALYDVFRTQISTENNLQFKILRNMANIKYNQYLNLSLEKMSAPTSPSLSAASSSTNNDLMKVYEKWLCDYRDFRSIIAAFINAADLMEQENYEEATPFFCVTCEYNERITSNLAHKMKGMDHNLLLANRRKCLRLWNQDTIRKFKGSTTDQQHQTSNNNKYVNLAEIKLNKHELANLIETMNNKFLPCLFRLLNSTQEDKAVVDEIRQEWLAVLDTNLPELQIFHDFMAKLFDDTINNHYHSLNVNKNNLTARYKETVNFLQKIKFKPNNA
jgi:hypothetical protein